MTYLEEQYFELRRRVELLEAKLAGQKPLTFTAPECNTPCNAGEEVLHMKSFEAGFKAAENYYRLNAICATYTGEGETSNWEFSAVDKKPLTFTASECNTPCNASEEVDAKLDKLSLQYRKVQLQNLAAYFEKHSRNNKKRANALDARLSTILMSTKDAWRAEHSSYYLSGKADAYARAAEKVREVLGEPKKPEVTGFGFWNDSEWLKKPAEKWITEFRFPEKNGWSPWHRSRNPVLKNEFSTEAAAQEAICAHQDSILMRRVRRID